MSNQFGRKFSLQISQAVKETRRELKMTMPQAIEMYQRLYSGSAVNWVNIENGTAKINRVTVIAICEVLGVTLNKLLSNIKEQQALKLIEVGEVIQSIEHNSVYMNEGDYACIMDIDDDRVRLSSGDILTVEEVKEKFCYVATIDDSEQNNVYIFENIEAVRRGITPTLLANNDNEIAWSYHNHSIKGFTTIAVYNEIGLDLSERAYVSEEISREVNGKWFNV